MEQALAHLVGEHDFAAFGMPMERTRDGKKVIGGTVRTLLAARCWRAADLVYFYVEANAFLRHMVRQIVGSVLRVGQRRNTPADILAHVQEPRAASAGPAAPAHGLYLVAVTY
jgi:tRNA pseudouridine38-40 synthase